MNWNPFLSRSPPDKPVKYVILDGQYFECDKNYAMEGANAGWLIFTGYYELNGVIHFTYQFLG